jgi:glycosyltransferase involved in cell wall biosynthesis
MDTVAVIIPTYNRAGPLRLAIESVRSQTYPGLEIIVVDDGSDDETADLLRTYDDCRYIRISHSGLPAVARNAGLRASSAAYISFLDSDDEWLPQKLHSQMEAMRETPCGFVCSNAHVVSTDPRIPSGPYLPAREKHSGLVLRELLSGNFVITSSVVLKRECLDAGGFSEDPRLRGLEDYDLWLRIAGSTPFHYMDQEMVRYNRSSTSVSGRNSSLAYWQGMELIFSRISQSLLPSDKILAATVQTQRDACRRSICDEYLANGQRGDFARGFAAFLGQRPVAAAKYLAAKMLR